MLRVECTSDLQISCLRLERVGGAKEALTSCLTEHLGKQKTTVIIDINLKYSQPMTDLIFLEKINYFNTRLGIQFPWHKKVTAFFFLCVKLVISSIFSIKQNICLLKPLIV